MDGNGAVATVGGHTLATMRVSIYPSSVPCPTVVPLHPASKLTPSEARIRALADRLGLEGETQMASQVRRAADGLAQPGTPVEGSIDVWG